MSKRTVDALKKIAWPLLAFAISLLILFLVYSRNGFDLFGTGEGLTGLISDGRSQYIAYFRTLREALQGKCDLFYTLGKLYGGNMMSLVTYYLCSPYNLLLVMFPSAPVETLMLWIEILKVATAAATAAVFLEFSERTASNRWANIGFALCYSLSSYAFGYMWDPFWLDGFLVLPLAALGIERICGGKGWLLYVLSIFYALLTSWYTGFMVCVFAVVYFLSEWLSKPLPKSRPLRGVKKGALSRYQPLWVFIRASLCAGLMSLPFWISLLYHMGGTKAQTNIVYGFRNPLNIIRNLLTGTYQGFSGELGNYEIDTFMGIFVSGACLVFASLYFFSSAFTVRKRVSRACLLLFFLAVMIVMPLDTMMHGMSRPTWFPCRYSFLIVFALALTGAEGYSGLKEVKIWWFIVPALLLAAGLFVGFTYQPITASDKGYVFSGAAVGLYLGAFLLALLIKASPNFKNVLIGFSRDRRRTDEIWRRLKPAGGFAAALLVSFLCGYGLWLKGEEIISSNVADNEYPQAEQYRRAELFEKDVQTLQDYAGDEAYRMENTFIAMPSVNVIDNDPLYFGYNGLSHYSSVEKTDVQNFARLLGFHYNGFFEKFDYGSTLTAESFLGLKYVIDDGSNPGWNLESYMDRLDLPSETGVSYYENPYALPLAFSVEPQQSHIVSYWDGATYQNDPDSGKTYWLNQFEIQNQLFFQLRPNLLTEPIFSKIDFAYSGPDETGFEYPEAQGLLTASGDVKRTLAEVWTKDGEVRMLPTYDVGVGAELIYSFESDGKSPVYWYFKDLYLNSYQDVSFYMDGKRIENQSYWHDGIVSFVPKEGTHTFALRFNKPYEGIQIRDGFYVEDLSVLKAYVEALTRDSVGSSLKEISSSRFEGKLTLTANPGALLTTFPLENGLKIIIDGKSRDLYSADEIFACCDISDLSVGDHEIAIIYYDQGFWFGYIVATLTMAGVSLFRIWGQTGFGGIAEPFVLERRGLRKHGDRLRRMIGKGRHL